jgi:hypothetical protein
LLRGEQRRRVGTGRSIDDRRRNEALIEDVAARVRSMPGWREPTTEERQKAFEFFTRRPAR